MWLRRRPYLEGAKGQVRYPWVSKRLGLVEREEAGGDTVLVIGNKDEGWRRAGQITKCVGMWVHGLNLRGEETHGKRESFTCRKQKQKRDGQRSARKTREGFVSK